MKSDIDIWFEYIRDVEKIDKPNTYEFKVEQISKKVEIKNIAKKTDFDLIFKKFETKKNLNFSLHSFSRGERRKFRSQATIDLHGYNRFVSDILLNFCLKCIVNNVRYITVVSGKGSGIVKNAVIDWLNSNTNMVYGYFELKDSVGGVGSFAVCLRQK